MKYAFRGRKTYSLILLGLLAICTGFSCNIGGDDGNRSRHSIALSTDDGSHYLMQLWERQAYKHGLDRDTIQDVSKLFYQVVDTQEYRQNNVEAVEESLDSYLTQFERSFMNEGARSGACYCMAWLLVQCAKRQPPTNDDLAETRAWFKRFKKRVITAVDENIVQTLGHDGFSNYEEQIEQTHVWIGRVLDYYFNELHDDPLFPMFKEPWNNNAEERVLEDLVSDNTFSVYVKRRRKLMVLEEEHVVEQMSRSYRSTPKKIILFALVYSNKSEWEKPEYWGGLLHYFTTKVSGKGAWPVEMSFRPQKKDR
jgi:hypothetical protein